MAKVSRSSGRDEIGSDDLSTSRDKVESTAATSSTDVLEKLNVYSLEAVAAADDPIWGGARHPEKIVVAARDEADARTIAASADTGFVDMPSAAAEDVSTAVLFQDSKAYSVTEVARGKSGIPRGIYRRSVS